MRRTFSSRTRQEARTYLTLLLLLSPFNGDPSFVSANKNVQDDLGVTCTATQYGANLRLAQLNDVVTSPLPSSKYVYVDNYWVSLKCVPP